MDESRANLRARVAAIAVTTLALLVLGVLVWIVGDVARRGLGHLSGKFLLEAPRDAGRAGGIAPILVSTLAILGVAIAAATPVALGSALFLAEFTGGREWLARWVRRSLDALAAVPSIVFGLFGNALFCHALGLGFSILSGGLTLGCMALPLLIRTTEDALRSVPRELRLGAAALGLRQSTTLFTVLLPAAAPGLAAGLVLGIGRALAETAALIFTAGYVTRMPGSLFDSGRALSVHIYDLSMNVPGGDPAAYASALVLIGLLLAVNAAAVGALRYFARRRSA